MGEDWTYGRSGWNKRGPSVKDQLEMSKRQSQIIDPDSEYWQNRAFQSRDFLILMMGHDEFEEWAERMFPGESVDSVPWKEIHEAYNEKFQRLQAESAMADFPDPENDPRHLKMNGGF